MKTRSIPAALALSLLLAPAAHAADPKSNPAAPAGAVPISDEAKKHFKAGVDFLQDPDGARYEEAYREFKEAYRLSPSWKILSNLGLAALKLERVGEAVEAYERYLSEGGKDVEPSERAQVEKDVRLSKAQGHTLVLRSTAPGAVIVTDERVRTTGGPVVNAYTIPAGKDLRIMVVAGQHVLTAKSGGRSVKWDTSLAADKASEHVFSMEAATPSTPAGPTSTGEKAPPASDTPIGTAASPLRTAGFVTAGVGGALWIGSVFTGLSAKSKESDLDKACPDRAHCPRSNEGTANSAKKMATVTNVLLVSGVVFAGAGVTLIVLGKPKASEGASLQLAPVATPGGAGGVLLGRF